VIINRLLYHFAVQSRPKMRRYFFAGRSEEVVASAVQRTGRYPRRSDAKKAASSRLDGEQVGWMNLYCELVLGYIRGVRWPFGP
jgi:hypothetical protein